MIKLILIQRIQLLIQTRWIDQIIIEQLWNRPKTRLAGLMNRPKIIVPQDRPDRFGFLSSMDADGERVRVNRDQLHLVIDYYITVKLKLTRLRVEVLFVYIQSCRVKVNSTVYICSCTLSFEVRYWVVSGGRRRVRNSTFQLLTFFRIQINFFLRFEFFKKIAFFHQEKYILHRLLFHAKDHRRIFEQTQLHP